MNQEIKSIDDYTGFRFDIKGGQKYFNIEGDMICFGEDFRRGGIFRRWRFRHAGLDDLFHLVYI